MVIVQQAGPIDDRCVRRAAYRLAGEAFALAIMGVKLVGISITIFDSVRMSRLGFVAFDRYTNIPPEPEAMSYIVGEYAADVSGFGEEFEAEIVQKPDLSLISPELQAQIMDFAARSTGPISALAEYLVVHKELSAETCYQVITEIMTHHVA
jgi:hypothetical protein